MKYISATFGVLLFVLLLGFALKNTQPVELHYYLGSAWRAPLSLMLLITLFVGIVVGVMACISLLIRQRRDLLALQRELKTLNANSQK